MRLFLATGNAHKIAELDAILRAARPDIAVQSAAALGGMPPVVEDGGTFLANARKKAAALVSRLPDDGLALADDSGLCVDALGGAPGVDSAHYAGPGAGDAANTAKLLRALAGVETARRTAAFHCTLVLLGRDGEAGVFAGRCDGRILEAPSGGGGFGYDPVFAPEGRETSFADLAPELKNAISHRARALAALVAWLSRDPALRDRTRASNPPGRRPARTSPPRDA